MKNFLIALAVGALSAFAFAPFGLWPLMLFAIGVLCELVWRSKSLKHALAIGWSFGLGQFVVGLNWIATAFTYQAAMPAWLGWVAVVLLSLYLAVYPALAAGLAWRFKAERPFALILTLAGSWAIVEWLRGTIFTGFPWNPIGVILVDTHLLNAATFIGTYGLSSLVVLAGGLVWLLTQKQWRKAGILAVALLLMHFMPWPQTAGATGKSIRVIQPNIGQEDKWRDSFADEAERRLISLSMKPP